MKYKKKPVIIEAIKFDSITADSLIEIKEILGFQDLIISFKEPNNPVIKIKTLEGTMSANIGDYIIKGVQGELYPCKPDIFEATYEIVEK
ncbi:hypothetical protein [Lactococcus lactis]|uniref:hypothetical protein n=1 Tax=Lactococcus lactis TaxID=1358 RepID=UPI0035BC92A4